MTRASISFLVLAVTLPRALDAVLPKGQGAQLANSDDLVPPGAPGSASLLLESELQAPLVDEQEGVLTNALHEWAAALQRWLQPVSEYNGAEVTKSGAGFLVGTPGQNGSLHPLFINNHNASGVVEALSAKAPRRISPQEREASKELQARVQHFCYVLVLLVFVLAYARIFYNHHYGRTCHRPSAFLSGMDAASESDLSARLSPEQITAKTAKDIEEADRKASAESFGGAHGALDAEELVERCGISGFSVLPGNAYSGISRISYRVAVPIICLQASVLQVGLLSFLITQLVPQQISNRPHLPVFIVFIAIYLHFLKCVQELPFVWQIFQHIHDFHQDTTDLFIFGGVLILDAFIVPLLSLILGALYLCASRSIGDIILNACAVAFIHEVDNWILDLLHRVNWIAGKTSSQVAHLPINKEAMYKFAWYIIFIPVVPCFATVAFIYTSYYVLSI
jgi:hypothetical protein